MATKNSLNNKTGPLTITDSADTTKEVLFDVSNVTTSTTRTLTMDDRNINFDAVPTSVGTDSVTCTPSGGTFSIVGSGSLSTSASGGILTLAGTGGSGGVTAWETVLVDDSYNAESNKGYIAFYTGIGGVATFTLPETSAIGNVLRFTSFEQYTGITVAQNAGQYIVTLANGKTTVGVGGSIEIGSLAANETKGILLLCVIANTAWIQLSGDRAIVVN